MATQTFQVIRTYIFEVEGLDRPVYGRVIQSTDPSDPFPYRWEVSHYCKPSEQAAGVYRPSRTMASTLDEADRDLRLFGETFTTLEVTANEYF